MNSHRIAAAALTALIVSACRADTGQTDVANASEVPAVSAAPAPALSPAPAPELDDPTIVAIFDAANTADIETGQLAREHGQSKAVRDFGAMLARDHETVRQHGRDLAKKLGVTPTPPADDAMAKAHSDAMTALRGKKGAEFDRAFLDHEVKFHQSVIDAVNGTLLPATKNAELRALVVKVAPAFEGHRIAAASLREKLGT